jgi:hypothetical protein
MNLLLLASDELVVGPGQSGSIATQIFLSIIRVLQKTDKLVGSFIGNRGTLFVIRSIRRVNRVPNRHTVMIRI